MKLGFVHVGLIHELGVTHAHGLHGGPQGHVAHGKAGVERLAQGMKNNATTFIDERYSRSIQILFEGVIALEDVNHPLSWAHCTGLHPAQFGSQFVMKEHIAAHAVLGVRAAKANAGRSSFKINVLPLQSLHFIAPQTRMDGEQVDDAALSRGCGQ